MGNYIRITDWKKFQHYKKRNPPWVKLYSWILDDDDFDCLPDDSKLLFFCLLPFASRRKNHIRLDFAWLQKKLPIKKEITKDTLQPLVTAEFVECYQDDSNMIAGGKQDATPETETKPNLETEREREANEKIQEKSLNSGGLGLNKEVKIRAMLFGEELDRVFPRISRDEATTFLRIAQHLTDEVILGASIEIFDKAIGWAKSAMSSNARNPKGLFVAKVKQETDFTGRGKLLNRTQGQG